VTQPEHTQPGRSRANGRPGAAALCSSPEQADAVAASVAAERPESLVVHHGMESGLSLVRATGDVDALLAAMDRGADVALYETASRQLLRHRRTWDLNTPSPGLSSIYITRARAGMSADDYHRYWEREHGPRALDHHMGMWDYNQVSVLRTVRGDVVQGIAVVQWPRREELAERFTDGSIGTSIIRHDAAQFTDLGVLTSQPMHEQIVVDLPLPASGTVVITDARHLDIVRSADEVWARLGRFEAMLEWWPPSFTACLTTSSSGVGTTRTLTRADGTTVIERLLDYRPDERMLRLSIDEGLPPEIHSYTCRYEVRPVTDATCRLDWYPRAVVDVAAVGLFGAIVDRGWPMVASGLSTFDPA
jgi:hypothetical protein